MCWNSHDWRKVTVLSETISRHDFSPVLQGNITGLTGTMDFKDSGSNSHVQFEILGSSFSETFGKDIKRVSSRRFTFYPIASVWCHLPACGEHDWSNLKGRYCDYMLLQMWCSDWSIIREGTDEKFSQENFSKLLSFSTWCFPMRSQTQILKQACKAINDISTIHHHKGRTFWACAVSLFK